MVILQHPAVAKALLQVSRVDPTADDNSAIRWASAKGHLAVVEELLQDRRADPTAVDIRLVRIWGRTSVLEALRQDGRADTSEDFVLIV